MVFAFSFTQEPGNTQNLLFIQIIISGWNHVKVCDRENHVEGWIKFRRKNNFCFRNRKSCAHGRTELQCIHLTLLGSNNFENYMKLISLRNRDFWMIFADEPNKLVTAWNKSVSLTTWMRFDKVHLARCIWESTMQRCFSNTSCFYI